MLSAALALCLTQIAGCVLPPPGKSASPKKKKAAAAAASAVAAAQKKKTRWTPLAEDGIHDPANPGIKLKQEPGEGMADFPPDDVGNRVRWVESLEEGYISPRTAILPEDQEDMLVMDLDVLRKNTSNLPMVKFPHKQHTAWLDCSNCHPALFVPQAGATRLNMLMVLNGEKCGLCHGAVAFPLTECWRCHSVLRGKSR